MTGLLNRLAVALCLCVYVSFERLACIVYSFAVLWAGLAAWLAGHKVETE